jgi:hypothetical protein
MRIEKENISMKAILRKNNDNKRCFKSYMLKMFNVLPHSFIDIENSTMIKHFTSIKCLKTFKKKNLKKLSKKFEFRATIKELS